MSNLRSHQIFTHSTSLPAMPRDHASFIKSFFLTSDNPTDHAGYVENFTTDATLKMGLRTAVGKDRKATFTKISI